MMEKKLNISGRLDFNEIDLTPAEKVINDILAQLMEETNGIVCGKIAPYSGHVMSYTRSGFSSVVSVIGGATADTRIDIQDDLGKIGQDIHKFECFLYTPKHEKYKYRMFFVKYDVANYPVNVILEESVARSISGSNSGYIYTCNTKEELENLVFSILNSKKIINVMQELIRVDQSKRKYAENKVVESDKEN